MSDTAGSPPDAPVDPWARPLHTPGGGDAFIAFVVFGADAELLEITTEEHRVDEVPPGVDAHELSPEQVRSFFDPPLGPLIRESDPETAALAEESDLGIVVTGTVTDPSTLDYLRNSIGIATAALDTGAVGVLDLQTFTLFDPERWRETVFDADRTLPHRLVSILYSAGPDNRSLGTDDAADAHDDAAADDRLWVHTRGLRVFGRPDLSVHDVEPDSFTTVVELVNVLIAQLARGLVIDDGMAMDVGGDLGTLTFTLGGDVDDPDFNNEHLEITWS